jgi:hypothetical protein
MKKTYLSLNLNKNIMKTNRFFETFLLPTLQLLGIVKPQVLQPIVIPYHKTV